MKWHLLAAATILIGGTAPAAGDDDVWREQSQKSVEVRGLSALEIVNSRGRVDLLPSPDGRLHLTALKIVRVGRRERADEVARDIVVETGARGDRYLVEVRYPRRHTVRFGFFDLFRSGGFRYPRYEVRLTAQVPSGLSVSVRETSGDIRSEAIAGPQTLRTTSGDVEVISPGGRVEVTSTSGDLRATALRDAHARSTSGDLVIRQASGPLRASTTSGDITVFGAEDSLSLSTTRGDIRTDRAPRGLRAGTSSGRVTARGVSGSVEVETASGDVRLSVHPPLRGIEASTSSGEIHLSLASGIGCALDLQTSSGTLEVTLPMEMRDVTRRRVRGTVAGGRSPVVLHTASGDITVVGGGS